MSRLFMKKNMSLYLVLILLSSLLLIGCTNDERSRPKEQSQNQNINFKKINNINIGGGYNVDLVVDPETRVEYIFNCNGRGGIYMTPRLNTDGKPIIFGERKSEKFFFDNK